VTGVPYAGEISSLLSALAWAGATVLFTRRSMEIEAHAMNLFKCGLASALYALTLLLVRGGGVLEGFDRRETFLLVLSGFTGMSLGDTFLFLCFPLMGARRALLLSVFAPVLVALLSDVFLHDPLGLAGWVGVLTTLGGVAIVIASERSLDRGPRFTPAGFLFGALSAVTVAVGMVLSKAGLARTSALEGSFLRVVSGFVGVALLYPVLESRFLRIRLPGPAARAEERPRTMRWILRHGWRDRTLVAGTLLGTYVGFLFFQAGFKYAHAGVAAALISSSPLFILPLAWVFLGERIHRTGILGTVLAVAGIAILFNR
jgi:drug/metabolite transporter (DMT)-like permease